MNPMNPYFIPNKVNDKNVLVKMHPGVVKTVYVKSENTNYVFHKLGESLPEGDKVEVNSPVPGTWVAES